MSQSRCKGCDRPIEWIEFVGANGDTKRIPLDPKPPTYEWHEEHVEVRNGEYEVEGRWRRSNAMVSHFATCPMADRFSSSNKPVERKSSLPYKDE